MYTPVLLFAIVGCVSIIGTLIVKWLTNRPLDHKEYSPEEMSKELESAFVARGVVELTTTIEYLPLLLEQMTASIQTGFPEAQIAALIHRISTQKTYYVRSAVFPISVDSVASDLDIQWVRSSDDRVQMRIEAVPELIQAIKQAANELPSTALA
ncbi:hypothetical protein VSU19_16195 [Verrucomicrobiales bacterium BCK34]|nr:hypothetical protein [Verrucomicrobiales bacterium BCK34]